MGQMKDPKMYQAMNNHCLVQNKMVNPNKQTVDGNDLMEFLNAQCMPMTKFARIVQFPAKRPDNSNFLMQVHLEAGVYEAIYRVKGVKDLFCADRLTDTMLTPSEVQQKGGQDHIKQNTSRRSTDLFQ